MARRISPEEARDLMAAQGYAYVDVRSIPEFEAGHPAGAFNVPLMHMGPAGMAPNPDFLSVMEKAFPKDARLVVGCKAGGRSQRAAALLESRGFTNVMDQKSGFEGAPQSDGRVEPGWRPRGLPVASTAASDHTYDHLKSKAGR